MVGQWNAAWRALHLADNGYRPKSKYAEWEDPPQSGDVFDYDAAPSRFYFEVESAGNLEPDAIIQQGIKVLQQKLAAVIQDLTDGEGGSNGLDADAYAPQSPGAGINGSGWNDQAGFTTPYGNGGQASAWGGGAQTPFGATPYGQAASNGWN
jgi:DNA-directed RNA polymerase II subunit RPB3